MARKIRDFLRNPVVSAAGGALAATAATLAIVGGGTAASEPKDMREFYNPPATDVGFERALDFLCQDTYGTTYDVGEVRPAVRLASGLFTSPEYHPDGYKEPTHTIATCVGETIYDHHTFAVRIPSEGSYYDNRGAGTVSQPAEEDKIVPLDKQWTPTS